MNNQLSYLQSMGSTADWSSVLFFLFIGTIYFLAPVVGYLPSKRGILLASLWAMIAKLAIGIFRECLFSVQALYAPPAPSAWNVGPAGGGPLGPGGMAIPSPPPVSGGASGLFGKFEQQLPALLNLAETVAFLAAIVLFVYGLQRLVLREPLMVPAQPGPER